MRDINEVKNLINNRLSWIKELSNEDCIIHPDMDGLLSMAFLQNFANMKQIVGVYDLDAFYVNNLDLLSQNNFKNLCAIDLDVSYLGIRSLGHHMTCVKSSENSVNINEFMGLTETPAKIVDNYYNKFPLNTVILLYSIFDIEPENDEEIALIVYADSVFENYRLYKSNVREWLIKLEQYEILDALDNRYEEIMKIIDNTIAPITNTIESRKKYSQCLLTYKKGKFNKTTYHYNKTSNEIIDLIRDITKWNTMYLPSELNKIKIFNNSKVVLSENYNDVSLIKKNIEKLDKFLKENSESIVSTSMTYKNQYKITTNRLNTTIKLINDNFQFVEK